jgi:hypothetical protein
MIFRVLRHAAMTTTVFIDGAMERVYAKIEAEAGPQVRDQSSVSGVWLPPELRLPEHEGLHGHVCTVAWAAKTWFRTLAKLGDKEAVVDSQWVFTAPDGAALGDPYEPVDPQGEDGRTDGVAVGEGYEVPFGGACPVQGYGEVDGHPCYYRARGKGWSLDVYPKGADPYNDLGAASLFEHAEGCYIWPAGGYVRPELSCENIARAVAKFRARSPSGE